MSKLLELGNGTEDSTIYINPQADPQIIRLVITEGLDINLYGKKPPSWFHRLMMRWLLGWKWEKV